MNIAHERDKVRRPCISYLRSMSCFNQLNKYPFLYWSCPPDVGKQKPHIAKKMKLDGYERGVYDLCVIAGNEIESYIWLIEFKYGKNGLTKEQKHIWEGAQNIKNVYTLVIRDLGSFENFIEKNLK